MTSYIDVTFARIERAPSIESTIHRWVARIEAMRFDVQRASVAVESDGRRRTRVSLTLSLMDGTSRTAAVTHADAYVAVADAFRVVRQQLLDTNAAEEPARPGDASRRLIA
jgi:ribosome-associated translation inhibitor RaiA